MNPLIWYRSKRNVPGRTEHRSNSPWKKAESPERVLVIRLHAVGDVALVLPACLAFRRQYPKARMDLLTSPESAPLAQAVDLFDSVFLLPRPSRRIVEWQSLLSTGSNLRESRYEVVLDLQRNWKSRWIRRIIRPESWVEFDRFSRLPACERTHNAFRDAGFGTMVPQFDQRFRDAPLRSAESLLALHGWRPGDPLVLLNPAGVWGTRNWPLQNYVTLAREWPGGDEVRFLLMGTERLSQASRFLADRLGSRLIDLSVRTSLDTAFAILSHVDIAVTEDSGLMHMAWCLGTPLVALFGSSRHYWSLPTGNHVRAFHSGDLACGACMQPQCIFGDTRCLTRVTPEAVLLAAQTLTHNHYREHSGR